MKKLLTFTLVMALALSFLTACGDNSSAPSVNDGNNNIVSGGNSITPPPSETHSQPETESNATPPNDSALPDGTYQRLRGGQNNYVVGNSFTVNGNIFTSQNGTEFTYEIREDEIFLTSADKSDEYTYPYAYRDNEYIIAGIAYGYSEGDGSTTPSPNNSAFDENTATPQVVGDEFTSVDIGELNSGQQQLYNDYLASLVVYVDDSCNSFGCSPDEKEKHLDEASKYFTDIVIREIDESNNRKFWEVRFSDALESIKEHPEIK